MLCAQIVAESLSYMVHAGVKLNSHSREGLPPKSYGMRSLWKDAPGITQRIYPVQTYGCTAYQ